jgi:hypothetical protein
VRSDMVDMFSFYKEIWSQGYLMSCKLLIIKKVSRVAGKQGFEPRFHDPESCVLPLDDFPAAAT